MNLRLYSVVLLKKIIYEDMSIALATKKIREIGFIKHDQSILISITRVKLQPKQKELVAF